MHEDQQFFTLSNGLRVVHQYDAGPAAHCAFIINIGSGDEKPDEHGLAHFLEHCFFKGTQKRSAYHILSRIDEVGGELNAFTSKEETAIHASFINTYSKRSIELLCDIITNPTFPNREINKEKLVVIDEIHSYLDSPYERIFDEFEEIIFEGSSLAHNILGTPNGVMSFRAEHLRQFKDRGYTAQNTVFAYRGNMKPETLKKLLLKNLPQKLPERRVNVQDMPKANKAVHINKKFDINQAHYISGVQAYSYHDSRYAAALLLNNILGGPGMNSRLNLNITEKLGLAYNIESQYISYAQSGLFYIYLGTDPERLAQAVKAVHKELEKLKEKPLSSNKLELAKKQFKGQSILAAESGLNRLMAPAKSVLSFGNTEKYADVYRQIEALTPHDLQITAEELFCFDAYSSLTYLPE